MEINKIYNENCLITMKNMPDNYVDFIITSPPYDDIRNYNGYQFEFEKIAKELFRIIKKVACTWVLQATLKDDPSNIKRTENRQTKMPTLRKIKRAANPTHQERK